MTDEQKWLLLFGRGWVDLVAIEDHPTKEARDVCVRLQQESKLAYAIGSGRLKLKEANE
jgi:hypothetical protein